MNLMPHSIRAAGGSGRFWLRAGLERPAASDPAWYSWCFVLLQLDCVAALAALTKNSVRGAL